MSNKTLAAWFAHLKLLAQHGTLPDPPQDSHVSVPPAPAAAPTAAAYPEILPGGFIKPAAFVGTPYDSWLCRIQDTRDHLSAGSADLKALDLDFSYNRQLTWIELTQTSDPLDVRLVTEAHDFNDLDPNSGAPKVIPNTLVFPVNNVNSDGLVIFAGFRLADCAELVRRNTASGDWNLPNHSNHGGFGPG